MIGVLAPYREIDEIVRDLRKGIKETIVVSGASVDNVVEVARGLVDDGAMVLVSRGGMTDVLRDAGIDDVPIVNIPITAYDILRSVAEGRRKARRVCIMAFESMVDGLDEVLEVLGDDVSLVTLKDGMDIPAVMGELAKGGETCFIGGAVTCENAELSGYPSVLIRSGRSAVSGAIHEACRMLSVKRAEEHKRVRLRAALDSIEDGVVVIDSEGVPELWNSAASLFFGDEDLTSSDAFQRFISDNGLLELVRSGRPGDAVVRSGEFASSVASVSPATNGAGTGGAVISLKDSVRLQALEQKVRSEVHSRRLVAERRLSDIVGNSTVTKTTTAAAVSFAAVDATVLILGESGTGKELYAQAMHNVSVRRNGPYVAINCAALPESLLESELFGYAPGAFTGATREGKPGLFELAHKGTLLLDEVSELPLSLQGKLLRVLQERTIRRVGGDRVIPVDVRILACTNRDLVGMMQKNQFRQDLFFRLDVLRLYVPALRERPDDILPLFSAYVRRFAKELGLPAVRLEEEATVMLSRYPWPGNVRELQNVVQRCLALYSGRSITAEMLNAVLSPQIQKKEYRADLPENEAGAVASALPVRRREGKPLAPNEIDSAIREAGGSLGKAAEILGVHRSTLWRHLRRKH